MSEEELDDLFGDDEEVLDQNSQDESGAVGNSQADFDEAEDEDDELAANRRGRRGGISENEDEDEDEDEEDEDDESKPLTSVDISLPRHAIPDVPEKETYLLKLPVFLQVENHPFDPADLRDKIQSDVEQIRSSAGAANAKDATNEILVTKLQNENTIRWRYSNVGDEIVKQSNCHFVQWDDGLVSLKLGEEFFDFKTLPVSDHYLVKTYDELEILQMDLPFTKMVNLLPSSTFTTTHRNLTNAIKSRQQKLRILSTMTNDDPMLKQRLADENDRKSMKLKRQLDLKRRLQQEKNARQNSPRPGSSSAGAVPTYERFARTYDEYDEDDDFIANDEDDVEEGMYDEEDELPEEDEEEEDEEEERRAAERLRQVKSAGAAKYESKRNLASVEPDDSDIRKKKRRIIEDDEDDE